MVGMSTWEIKDSNGELVGQFFGERTEKYDPMVEAYDFFDNNQGFEKGWTVRPLTNSPIETRPWDPEPWDDLEDL
jgi:hypothetical protein